MHFLITQYKDCAFFYTLHFLRVTHHFCLNVVALSCIYWKVSGTLVEVVVRPGDNATLPCDCEIVIGQEIRWVKICSSQIQPPLIISAYNSILQPIPRFYVFWNNASKSYDLVIENITGADLGLYYCSRVEKNTLNRME